MGDCKTDVEDYTPIAELFIRIGKELRNNADVLNSLSLPIEDALSRNPNLRRPTFIRSMQELDRAQQSLTGIADFLDALSSDMPEDWRLNPSAFKNILTLSQLADRLCSKSDADASASKHESGEWELF